MKKIFIFIAALFPLFIFSSVAYAQLQLNEENRIVERRQIKNNIRSYDRIVLAEDEVVNDNYFASGENITISGTVNGDLYALGGTIFVDGEVNGDVLVAGGQVTLRGPVSQDIRVAGGNVTISSEVGGSVTAIGGNVLLADSASIDGSLVTAGGSVEVFSPVGESVTAAVGQLTLADEIGGDVKAGVGTLTVTSEANITGDIVYASDSEIDVSDAATVSGAIVQKVTTPKIDTQDAEKTVGLLAGASVLFKVLSLISTFIVAFLLIWLLPNYTESVAATVAKRPWMSLLIGLIAVIVTPIIALILLVTVIGAPLSLLLFISYIAILYLSKIFVIYAVGKKLLSSTKSNTLTFLGGLIVYGIVTWIPIVGGIVSLGVLLIGAGAILIDEKSLYHKLRAKKFL